MLSPAEVNRQWYEEMWNGRREELIDVLMSEDAVAHGLGPERSNTDVRRDPDGR